MALLDHVRKEPMTHDIEITGMAHGGEGVGRIDGQVCFVPYALPGERLHVSIERRSKGVLRGAMREILKPSPARNETSCPIFGQCGGCSWLHFAYPAQAEAKRQIVRDCFERIAKIEADVGWRENSDLRMAYRTRAKFRCKDGHWGFYEARSHSVVEVQTCPLCHPKLNDALARLSAVSIEGAVELTINPEGGEVLVWSKEEHPELRKAFQLVNSMADAKRAQFRFDGVPIVNGAFSQSSLLLNRLLRECVHQLIPETAHLLDLYCGAGNLSLSLAPNVSVHGLDHNKHGILAARADGVAKYRVGSEKDFVSAVQRFSGDVILLDPPRAGAKAVIPAIAASRASTVVYVSCDPATLARDALALVDRGWKLIETIALDLFPHTAHVETVCRFQR